MRAQRACEPERKEALIFRWGASFGRRPQALPKPKPS